MVEAHSLKALLLIGGRSRRMGTDKANLMIEGETLLERTANLVLPLVDELYLSVAHDHHSDTLPYPIIKDLSPEPGPLGGLQAAFAHDDQCAWLIIACDLPLLDNQTLSELIDSADSSFHASCYLNRLDHCVEPLCTLYQPSAAPVLVRQLAENRRCARKFLESLEPQTLQLPNALALDNANRPEHLQELQLLAKEGFNEKTVAVTYYGKLSGEAPHPQETITTTAATLAGLYEELRLRHRFSLDLDIIKPVLADEFQDWTTPLPEHSQVAFLPPFAGG